MSNPGNISGKGIRSDWELDIREMNKEIAYERLLFFSFLLLFLDKILTCRYSFYDHFTY
jgi:hypothetical protein